MSKMINFTKVMQKWYKRRDESFYFLGEERKRSGALDFSALEFDGKWRQIGNFPVKIEKWSQAEHLLQS